MIPYEFIGNFVKLTGRNPWFDSFSNLCQSLSNQKITLTE